MLKPSYPGVYPIEQKSGLQTISAASTSVAAFFGTSPKGPLDTPVRVLNFDDFEHVFGNGMSHGEMPIQVRQFFMNGGGTAWITRIANGAVKSKITLNTRAGAPCLELTANDSGLNGDHIHAIVDYDCQNSERAFNLTLVRRTLGLGLSLIHI